MTRFFACSAAVAAIVIASGCGGDDGSDGSGDSNGAIRIGAPLSLTGEFSPDAKLVRDGYEMWAEAVNAEGGIDVGGEQREVELVIEDDGSDRDQAVRLAENLITEENVDFLLAPWGSGNTSAVAPIADRYQKLMIAPLAASDEIWDAGYQYLFGILPRSSSFFWPVIDMGKELGVKSVAVISSDDDFPLASAEGARERIAEQGLELVVDETYPPETVDVGPVITRVENADPDMVINTADTNDAIIFTRGLEGRDYMPALFSISGAIVAPEYADALGEGADDVYGISYWSSSLPYSDELFGSTEDFSRDYEDAYGYAPHHDGVAAATAGYVLGRAIEEAGTVETDAVRDALAGFSEETVFGPVEFDDDGSNVGIPSYAAQIQDGALKIVYPPDVAEAKPIYPVGEGRK